MLRLFSNQQKAKYLQEPVPQGDPFQEEKNPCQQLLRVSRGCFEIERISDAFVLLEFLLKQIEL